MENQNDINYICARWRDANTDPPPDGWIGLNVMASGACYYGACGFMPGDQWLDVSSTPAVPRADVQAAVDEIARVRRQTVYTHQGVGLDIAMDSIRAKTGISPTEDSK